jgi:hypothetical protein
MALERDVERRGRPVDVWGEGVEEERDQLALQPEERSRYR